jgi:hypothetical protein
MALQKPLNKKQQFAAKMASLGFIEADDTVHKRIILSIGGREKQGKTHLALSAPAPIGIFSSDIGTEGVVNKFKREGKDIWAHEMQVPEKHDEAKEIWENFKKAYYGILRVPEIRTVIFDTATEIWELLRICRFGKLTQVMPYQYGPVNAEYRRLLKDCYSTQKNLILLHKMKPVYIDDKRTKNFENAQFSDTPYIAQVNVEVFRSTPKKACPYCKKSDGIQRHWGIKIKDCRQNPELIDKVFTDQLCTFPFIASLIVPESDQEDWE